LVWDESHLRVLTLTERNGNHLPRVDCSGQRAPWDELTDHIQEVCGVHSRFQWVGMWQDVARDEIEFVFAASVDEVELSDRAEWSLARTTPLQGRDAEYVERVKASYMSDPVWSMTGESSLEEGETIHMDEGRKHGAG
jgi:hypothetical protein